MENATAIPVGMDFFANLKIVWIIAQLMENVLVGFVNAIRVLKENHVLILKYLLYINNKISVKITAVETEFVYQANVFA